MLAPSVERTEVERFLTMCHCDGHVQRCATGGSQKELIIDFALYCEKFACPERLSRAKGEKP